MREALGPTTLANMLRMITAEANNFILVVEGEEDKFVVSQHLSPQIQIVPGNIGRDSILHVAKSAKIPRVCYLIDRDLDNVLAANECPEMIVASESHDIIMDLVLADLSYLDRAIHTLTRKARLKSSVSLPTSRELIDGAFDLAWHLVPIRIANQKSSFGIRLRDFPFGELNSSSPTWEEVVRVATLRNQRAIAVSKVLAAVESEIGAAREHGRALIGDHDFFSSVSRLLREYGINKVTREDIESTFLATVDCNLIAKTLWAKNLRDHMQRHDLLAFDCPHLETASSAA